MSDPQTAQRLLAQAKHYGLSGADFCARLPIETLAADYNGIGPEWFPDCIRRAIDKLSADLQCVAMIHDVRFAHADGSTRAFNEANAELESNGRKVADAKFSWYNPKRYLVRREAHVFADLCQRFGWTAYVAACVKGDNTDTFAPSGAGHGGRV